MSFPQSPGGNPCTFMVLVGAHPPLSLAGSRLCLEPEHFIITSLFPKGDGEGCLFSFIDFFAVADAKHNNIFVVYIKDYAIMTDAETEGANVRVGKPFGVLERILFKA